MLAEREMIEIQPFGKLRYVMIDVMLCKKKRAVLIEIDVI